MGSLRQEEGLQYSSLAVTSEVITFAPDPTCKGKVCMTSDVNTMDLPVIVLYVFGSLCVPLVVQVSTTDHYNGLLCVYVTN